MTTISPSIFRPAPAHVAGGGSRHAACRRPGRLVRVATAAALVAGAFALPASGADPEVKLTPLQAQNLGVRVARPMSSRSDRTIAFPAQMVVPTPQLWVVSTPAAGMVTSLSVARGDRIERGQPLVTLESPSFVSLQREYLQAVAHEALAMQQLRRNNELFSGRAVPQRVVEASETEARQANIAVAERRQMLRLSGMSDAMIEKLTNEAAITATLTVAAPESGTVIEVAVSPGVRIEQSVPLLKLAKLSPLWVEIAVPAFAVRAIRPGARVDIDSYDTPGQVVLVSESADAATQTVLVRAEVPNDGNLRPGQTVAARIAYESPGGHTWQIPYSALIRRGESTAVFVASEGGFRLVNVTLVAEDQEHVHVTGPVSDQDEVATAGVSALRGMLLGLGVSE